MCEEDSVEYLRDLINEKDSLDKEEERSLLKKLLSQGKTKKWATHNTALTW